MDTPPRDTIRFSHAGGGGSSWILVDLTHATIARRSRGDPPSGTAPRALAPADVTRLRALAEAVRPEHAQLQPSHLTYAQDESLEVVLGGQRCFIDASSGEVCAGPPAELLEALGEILRALQASG